EVAKSQLVTVEKGGVPKRVSIPKPAPMATGTQTMSSLSLKGPPFRFVLALLDEKDQEITKRNVGVTILEPHQYVEVTSNSVYDPKLNQLRVQVKALPQFSGPACQVDLELIPERIPGFVSNQKRVGTYRGVLHKGGQVWLLAEKLQFQGGRRQNGLVHV